MSAAHEMEKVIRSIVADELRKQLDAAGLQLVHVDTAIPPTPTDFFYCREAAEQLRRTEAAVRWLWQTGALRSRIVGGRRVSTQADIDEFLLGDAS